MFAGLAKRLIPKTLVMKSSVASHSRWMADLRTSDAATPVVSAFYDRFPFPGDPLQDGPPLDTTGAGAGAACWRRFMASLSRGGIALESSMPDVAPG